MKRIALQASNSQYVCAEDGGGRELVANRSALKSWETFILTVLGNSRVALQASNGQYVCAEDGGGRELVANRSALGSWETFTLTDLGNNRVALQASNGQYVCAEDGGGRELVANRSALGSWETFTKIDLESLYPEEAATNDTNDTANKVDVERNKRLYREFVTQKESRTHHAQAIMAHQGKELDADFLNDVVKNIGSNKNADFRLVQLVRIVHLYGKAGKSEDKSAIEILEAIHPNNLKYWLKKGEKLHVYWTENHMILWLSSAYLMKQMKGWEMDPNLENRLHHYLDLKVEYGFYEFFSPTYLPYTFAGLMNLADFAEDQEIRSKAEAAAKRLLREILMLTNDKGVYFPVAGRTYIGKYFSAYAQNHNALIDILIGKIESIKEESIKMATHAGAFLATSSINFDDVAASWSPELSLSYSFGHSLSDSREINKNLTRLDRVMFQWTFGAYIHSDFIEDSRWVFEEYNLRNHYLVGGLDQIFNAPLKLDQLTASFGRSWIIANAKVNLYKNHGVVLSSIEEYFPGYFGYQQWPWVATVDTLAVWTQSGEVLENWSKRADDSDIDDNANSHLPCVKQVGNIALVVYNPNTNIQLIAETESGDEIGRDTLNHLDVSLHWPDDKFDQKEDLGRWLFGCKGESYIGVLRPCTDKVDNQYVCRGDRGRQMWAVVVGNKNTYESFDNFKQSVGASKAEENFEKSSKRYFTSITVGDVTVSHVWEPNDETVDIDMNGTANHLIGALLPLVNRELPRVIRSSGYDPIVDVVSGREGAEVSKRFGKPPFGIGTVRAKASVHYSIKDLEGLSSLYIEHFSVDRINQITGSDALSIQIALRIKFSSDVRAKLSGTARATLWKIHPKVSISGKVAAEDLVVSGSLVAQAKLRGDSYCLAEISRPQLHINYEDIDIDVGDLGFFEQIETVIVDAIDSAFGTWIKDKLTSLLEKTIDNKVSDLIDEDGEQDKVCASVVLKI